MTASNTSMQQGRDAMLLLTLSETQERLRLSKNGLRAVMNSGALPTVRIGRRRFVSPADLERFITSHREELRHDGR